MTEPTTRLPILPTTTKLLALAYPSLPTPGHVPNWFTIAAVILIDGTEIAVKDLRPNPAFINISEGTVYAKMTGSRHVRFLEHLGPWAQTRLVHASNPDVYILEFTVDSNSVTMSDENVTQTHAFFQESLLKK